MNATTAAVDLAKSVFQLAVADASWKVVETPDNSSGCLPAARTDWHRVSRFHVGTGHCEPTTDAGYTTARVSQQPKLSISFLPFWGSPYRKG